MSLDKASVEANYEETVGQKSDDRWKNRQFLIFALPILRKNLVFLRKPTWQSTCFDNRQVVAIMISGFSGGLKKYIFDDR